MAARQHGVGDFGMARCPLELEHGRFIAAQAEPVQPVEDRGDRFLGRAGAIGILDPQQELAAMMAGEQPVEQGGAGTADMEEACWRGGETGHHRLVHSRCVHRHIA